MDELVIAPSGIGYPIWRRPTGTPLLLLHGFTGSHESWSELGDRLPDHHLVTTLDLPGHGQSVLPHGQSWGFTSVVDDLAWISSTRLGDSANVLGYSMGGRIALGLAIAYPHLVRRLILESASPGIANEQERRERQSADERLAERIEQGGVDAFVAHWASLPMWESQSALPAEVRERQQRIRSGHWAAGLAASLRATGTGVQPSYWEQLGHLEMPTLLIAGALDHKFARIAEAMRDAMPTAQLEVVANAGHAVHLEQPAQYAQLVSHFVEQPGSNPLHAKGDGHD